MTMHGILLTPTFSRYHPAVHNLHSLLMFVGNGLQYIVALLSQPRHQASLQTPAAFARTWYAEVHCARRNTGLTKFDTFPSLSNSL